MHGRVHRLYTAVDALCTRPLNAGVVHPVNGRVHGHIHSTYTAVHTGRKHGRLHGRKHGRVHGHGRTMYTAVYAAGTWQNTAGYAARTRPCTYRIHGRARAVYRVHGRLHGRLYGPCARPCMYHVHGRAWSVHDPKTAVYKVVYPVHGRVYGPCTRLCTVYMHVFMACVYGRQRPCTDCARPPSAVYKLCTRPYTGHAHGPSVSRTRPCTRAIRTAV